MDRIERIEAMEEKLNAALAAIGALERALEDYAAVREDVRALDAYLSGAEWREDFAADEAGLLPDGLRRPALHYRQQKSGPAQGGKGRQRGDRRPGRWTPGDDSGQRKCII